MKRKVKVEGWISGVRADKNKCREVRRDAEQLLTTKPIMWNELQRNATTQR